MLTALSVHKYRQMKTSRFNVINSILQSFIKQKYLQKISFQCLESRELLAYIYILE